jgi:hypothetical protein
MDGCSIRRAPAKIIRAQGRSEEWNHQVPSISRDGHEVGDAISGGESVNLIGQGRNSVKERNGPDWRLRRRRQILDEDFFRLAG